MARSGEPESSGRIRWGSTGSVGPMGRLSTVYDRVRTVLADDARTEVRLDGTEEDAPDPVPRSVL